MVFLVLQFLNDLIGLFRHLFINILSLLVILVDAVGFSQRLLKVTLHEQVYSFCAILHTSGGIDTRPNLETDIAHRNLTTCQTADLNNRLQTYRWTLVQLFQSMEGKDTVFSHDRHDIGSDAHRAQVE